jgi:hypothetical protein
MSHKMEILTGELTTDRIMKGEWIEERTGQCGKESESQELIK